MELVNILNLHKQRCVYLRVEKNALVVIDYQYMLLEREKEWFDRRWLIVRVILWESEGGGGGGGGRLFMWKFKDL